MRLIIAGLLLSIIAVEVGAEEAGATKRFKSKDGKYSIAVPAGWKTTVRKDKDFVVALTCQLQDGRGTTYVSLQALTNSPMHRAAAVHEMIARPGNYDGADARMHPLPHARKEYGNGKRAYLGFPQRVRGHVFLVVFQIELAREKEFTAALAGIVQSVNTTKPPFPPEPPAGFRKSTKKQFRYYSAKGLKGNEVHKILSESLKNFERFHGRIVRPKGAMIDIVHYQDRRTIRDFAPKAAAEKSRFFHARGHPRFYVKARDKDNWVPSLYSAVVPLFFEERYGIDTPVWVVDGEGGVAFARKWTGKKKVVSLGFAKRVNGVTIKRLDALPGILKRDRNEYAGQAWAYVHFFRYGPAKYRKAYKAFLKDFAETHDPFGAEKRHLLSLDQDAMREQVLKHRSNMKVK